MSSSPIIKPIVLSRQLLTMRNIAPELYEYGTNIRDAINSLNASLSALSQQSITGTAATPAVSTPNPPAIQSYTLQNLAGTVSVTADTDTLIDSMTVNMPTSGGPWRALVHYAYYINGGVGWIAGVNDGTNDFAAMQTIVQNNNSCARSGEVSPVTYYNGQVVTFQTRIYGDANGTVVLTPAGEGSPGRVWTRGASHMSVAIFSSN